MMIRRSVTFVLLTLSILGISAGVNADWQLSQSTFNFTSTKNDTITERHSISSLAGWVDNNGKAQIIIDLNHVDTGIEIRNQRMQKFLYPKLNQATYSAKLDLSKINTLPVGQSMPYTIAGNLEINGYFLHYPMDVNVKRISLAEYSVSSVSDNPLNLVRIGYDWGLEHLRQIAKLQSISTGTNINFSLVFKKQ